MIREILQALVDKYVWLTSLTFVLIVVVVLALLNGCIGEAPRQLPQLVREIKAEPFDAAPDECRKYRRVLESNASYVWGMEARIPVFGAQMHQESSCNAAAQSSVGAQGIAQFMPGTAGDTARKHPELGGPQPFDPEWALRAMVTYDHDLFQQVRYPKECDRMGAMLSAYNGGLGWHNRRQARAGNPNDFWDSVRVVNPGITEASQAENQRYPVAIIKELQPRYASWGITTC